MRLRIVSLFALREVRSSVKGRWFLVGTVTFALLALAVSRLGMAGAERWGVSTFDRSTVALLNLVFLFVPLLTLPLGAASFAGEAEDGSLAYLMAQPVTRGEIYLGKVVGLLGAMTLSLGLGFGGAAMLIGAHGGSASRFGVLVAGAWLLGVVMTLVGVLLATLAKNRVRALAAAMGAWILLVFLCDFGVLALAASQSLGPEAMFGIAVANPLEAVKTLVALFVSKRLEVLGPVGVHAVQTLGRGGLAMLLVGVVALWSALSAGAGYWLFRRGNFA